MLVMIIIIIEKFNSRLMDRKLYPPEQWASTHMHSETVESVCDFGWCGVFKQQRAETRRDEPSQSE